MSDTELLRRTAFLYDKREAALWKPEMARLRKSKVKADRSKRERIRKNRPVGEGSRTNLRSAPMIALSVPGNGLAFF